MTIILGLEGYTHLLILLHSLALADHRNILDSLDSDSLNLGCGRITGIPTGANLYALTDCYEGYFKLYCHNSDYEHGITINWLKENNILYEEVPNKKHKKRLWKMKNFTE